MPFAKLKRRIRELTGRQLTDAKMQRMDTALDKSPNPEMQNVSFPRGWKGNIPLNISKGKTLVKPYRSDRIYTMTRRREKSGIRVTKRFDAGGAITDRIVFEPRGKRRKTTTYKNGKKVETHRPEK